MADSKLPRIGTVEQRPTPKPAPLVHPPLPGSLQYVICRTMQHQWHHRGMDPTRLKEPGLIAFVSVCTECHTERTKWINGLGQRVGQPVYDRSACPDYAEKGDGRHTRQQWAQAFADVLFREMK